MNPPDERIGRYAIDEVIATGAFATVYRATDERLDGTVVLKLLADNHCLDPDIRARFVDEGRALRRIDSPHVLRIYDAGETDRLQPYLVLEHADRGSLAQRVAALRADGWQPDRAALTALVAGLAAAVSAVHAADLVHRDLSPRNILLRSTRPASPALSPVPASGPRRPDPSVPILGATGSTDVAVDGRLIRFDERLVLGDLGLSKDLARSSGLTVAGGTDGFRPPEQRGRPTPVDRRADLWGLSAVVFWLLTQQAPGHDDALVDQRVLDRIVADLGLPAAVAPAVLTSLATDPTRRHQDVEAWHEAMLDALVPVPPPPTPPPSPPAQDDTQAPATETAPPLAATAGTAATGAATSAASQTPGGPRRSWSARHALVALVAAAVLGIGLGAAAAVAVTGGDGDDPSWTTTRLEGGRVQRVATDSSGDSQLALIGDVEATVGETVRLSAETVAVDEWVWLMPDGTVYANQPSVQLRSSTVGTAPVSLLAMAGSGERLEVVHELRVVES